MSVRFWRSAGNFAASYICISHEICTVPSLYRPSTDGLILQCDFIIGSEQMDLSTWQND